MILKYTYLHFLIGITLLCKPYYTNNSPIDLLTTTTQFVAGDTIVLKFSNSTSKTPSLYVGYSYGATVIKPNKTSGNLSFTIPQHLSNKTGIIHWKLLSENSLSGKINILSKPEPASLETYLGPPSIEAGGTDYAMFVLIPTDTYDNPLANGTKVTIKHQFLKTSFNNEVFIKNSMAYMNIYSLTQTGRIFASSECLGLNSKEYTVNVMPAIPTNFTISNQRNHDFADGNQITTFSTSIIKDKYGNIVSDGTYVEFFIKNNSNYILKTAGTTINGMAQAKMIHPNHQEQWEVKAFIEGMAESNTIKLTYKSIISNFDVHFSDHNRLITVGPLKSFMNQMIPDGLEVSLTAYHNDIKTQTLIKNTFEGFATFKLDNNNFPAHVYNFKIITAGLEKTYTNIKL